MHRALSASERKQIQRLSAPAIEEYLDKGEGACHLRNPAVADETASALRHFDEQRYRLFAWCVMPNHVHVVARLFPSHALAAVVHSWKSFSAKTANRLLGLRGAFWQREYYDHLIRNESDFEHSLDYVAENPAKARLKDWKWVWVCGRDARTTAAEDGGATKPPGS